MPKNIQIKRLKSRNIFLIEPFAQCGLKREWLNDEHFEDIEQVRERVEQVVALYNGERPHFSIGLKTPNTVYRDFSRKYEYQMY